MTATRTAALTASALLLLAGCGGSEEPGAADDPEPTQQAPAATASTSAAAPGGATGTVLRGTLGTSDNPNAFEIGLLDASGAEVTSLRAGTYEIEVDDRSRIHNFHLTGSGVDVETGVSETGTKRFTVTLQAGEYRYVCDPHPDMQGTFEVTA